MTDTITKDGADIVDRLRSPEFADVAAKYLMAEAAAEIERFRSLTQWRTITDNEPPHETDVLLYSPPWSHGPAKQEVGFASQGRRWKAPDGGTFSNMSWHGSATHWLPLPPGPEREDPT